MFVDIKCLHKTPHLKKEREGISTGLQERMHNAPPLPRVSLIFIYTLGRNFIPALIISISLSRN